MFNEALSPEQLQVINALSDGVTSTDAAAQAGVHRNSIANWRRNSLFFREALADAQYDRALLFRDKTEAKIDLALETLDGILRDPKASASARLKAALFIIDKACTPPPPRKYVPFDVEEIRVSQPTVHPVHNNAQSPTPAHASESATPPATSENSPAVHNNAQTPPAPKSASAPTTAENPPSVHNNAQSAQSPIRRETPKVGRNEACPCGSGRKYKHCCLNHPQTAAA